VCGVLEYLPRDLGGALPRWYYNETLATELTELTEVDLLYFISVASVNSVAREISLQY
jgi:hypothetical protein